MGRWGERTDGRDDDDDAAPFSLETEREWKRERGVALLPWKLRWCDGEGGAEFWLADRVWCSPSWGRRERRGEDDSAKAGLWEAAALSLFFFSSDARGHIGSTGSPQRPPLDNPGSAEEDEGSQHSTAHSLTPNSMLHRFLTKQKLCYINMSQLWG